MNRSYLFAPGHNEKLLGRVFDAGADAVMLDLEDGVPPHAKQRARAMAATFSAATLLDAILEEVTPMKDDHKPWTVKDEDAARAALLANAEVED